jgi:MoxR-like ATPase
MYKKHIILKGQKAQGKTNQLHKMIKEKSLHIEFIAGHEGLESIDLQGFLIKHDDGNLIWKDGALTAAFRKASQGIKTALFIDEILRIPKRELNILIGCLTPNSDGFLVLRTGRVSEINKTIGTDGEEHSIAEEETIYVKPEYLWAVGTTNAGAGYAVETIDEALADRFRIMIVQMSENDMKKILIDKLTAKSWNKDIANNLMDFYKSYNTLRESGELTKTTSIRHLVEAIDLADTEDHIELMIKHLIPTLTEEDINGDPNESQSAIIEEIIEKTIG